jgi:hypothetical protein
MHHHPVRSRAPKLSAALIPMNCFQVMFGCLNWVTPMSCEVLAFQHFHYHALLVVTALNRCIFTFIKFQIAHESLRVVLNNAEHSVTIDGSPDTRPKLPSLPDVVPELGHSKISSSTADRSGEKKLFYSRTFRKWTEDSNLVAITYAAMAIAILPSFYFIANVTPEDRAGNSCFANNAAFNAISNIYRAMVLIVVFSYLFRFRRETLDKFWLYESTKYGTLSAIGMFACFLILNLVPSMAKWNYSVFPLDTLLAEGYFTLMLYLEIIYPCILSFKYEKLNSRQDNSGQKLTLEDVIHSKEMESAFVEFLEMEFSLENWLFIIEVNKYQKKVSDVEENSSQDLSQISLEMLKTRAKRLYDEFIADNSVHQVNISGAHKSKIESQLSSSEQLKTLNDLKLLFQEGADEIFHLLKEDSFRRFLRSDVYLELASIREKEALRVAGF